MGRCNDPTSTPASFFTSDARIELTQDGNSVLVSPTVTLTEPVWVSSAPAETASGAQVFEWRILESDFQLAVGLVTDADAEVIGEDIINCLYATDGRIIVDGEVVRTTMSYGIGSVVSLYIDADASLIVWLLDEAPV